MEQPRPVAAAPAAMRFFVRTLGCKMNWLDSARITALLQSAGHIPAAREEDADFVFINSCTVTAEADRKSRKQANAAARTKPVAVFGCSPRVDAERWNGDGRMVFTDESAMLAHFGVDPSQAVFPVSSRTRLPIAIQYGCDNRCTFCITRVARGAHSNVPIDQVVQHIHEAEAAGIKEVILTGINLAAWGADDSNRAEQARLHELLEAILARTGMPRIRLSSLGPQYLHPGFFDVFADPRICDHLHLSIQSGSPTVLERMDRGHGVEEVYRIAERARAVRPDVALATDLIVGFPGEGEGEFQQTAEFARDIGFAKLHVFPYSPREGTPAARWGDNIDGGIKKARAAELRDIGRATRQAFIDAQMGRELQVLAETGGKGLSTNYIRVHTLAAEGTIRPVRLSPATLAEGHSIA